MKKRLKILSLCSLIIVLSFTVLSGFQSGNVAAGAQQAAEPTTSWTSADIGDVGTPGSFSAAGENVAVSGSGADIWGSADAFQFVYTKMTGDGQIVAKVASLEDVDDWTKAGLMMRETLDAGSKHAFITKTARNGVSFQRRVATESDHTTIGDAPMPIWLKLTRQNDGDAYEYTSYYSPDGNTWTEVGQERIAMADEIYVGIAVTSHKQGTLAQATFEGVKLGNLEVDDVVVKNVSMGDPTNLYILENGSVEPDITVKLKKNVPANAAGKVKVSLYSRGDKDAISEQTYDFTIAGNDRDGLFTFKMPVIRQADYYNAAIQVIYEDKVLSEKNIQFGVIRQAAAGIRENSPFGMVVENADKDLNLTVAEKIGVKWVRGIQGVDPGAVWPKKDGMLWDDPNNKEGQEKINKARDAVKSLKDHGLLTLGAVFYNMDWNIEPIPGKQAGVWENRPADLDAQAKVAYHMIAPLHDVVKNWEIWNEPWVHGWTWATGDAEDYRQLLKKTYELVKKDFPDVNIIGGGSVPYQRDIVYANNTSDIGYLDGSVSHAYGMPDPHQLGDVKIQKLLDQKYSISGGAGGIWQTEIGTSKDMFGDLPEDQKAWAVATTVAPTYLLQMLGAGDTPLHVFWFMVSATKKDENSFNIYDYKTGSPKPAVIAYSAMTHFLEDSKMKEELYPESKSTWGFLFEKQDGKANAAIYLDKDYAGTLTLNNAKGLRVYDYLGTQISDGSNDTARVELKPWETVYIESDLTPAELKKVLGTAGYELTQAVKVSPLSFVTPVQDAKSVDIKVENVSVEKVQGTLNVSLPEGWELGSKRGEFALNPGEIKVISLPIKRYAHSDINRYVVRYTVDIEKPNKTTVSGSQTIQAAYAPFKTIAVDGSFEDWNGIEAVTMVSNGNPDYLDAVLDPRKVKDQIENGGDEESVIYTAKTAWDLQNFYFMINVPDAQLTGNDPFEINPYAFPFETDSIQLAFDSLDKNPDDFLLGDPYYEKAVASDVDYIMVATLAKGNIPELYRNTAPGTNYQGYFPTNGDLFPKLGPMDATEAGGKEGRIKIVRDQENKVTRYEIAIAWSSLSELYEQLHGLKKGNGVQTNFAFWVNDTGEKAKYISTWTREAGQVESGTYGYAPFWRTGSKTVGGRIITRWGFVR